MVRRIALLVAIACALAAFCFAQKPKDKKEICPYCKNDPAILAKLGLVGHGPFEFGSHDSAEAEAMLGTCDIKWIESKHFKIGFALGPWKLKDEERKKVHAELERMAGAIPKLDTKTALLDPWLRAHLTAQRCEDIWKRVSQILQVDDSMFPDGKSVWDMRSKYMGTGPFLGEKGKPEILILPSEAAVATYLKGEFGLGTKLTQRWNIVQRDTMSLVVNTQQANYREDAPLHGHLAFNLSINLLDAYKHYSYETPVWLREGIGHFVEREISPKYNTFDSSEGAVASMTSKAAWEPEVKKLVASADAPRMAELISMKDYAELTLPRHFAVWSMVDFLIKTNPKGFACLQDAIHGRTNAKGYPDGSNLGDVHREKFKECLGFASYQEFDAAWAAWVQANYSGG